MNREAQESTILLPQFLVLGLQFLARGCFWCVTQGLIKNTVPFSKWGLPILIWWKFQIGESPFQKGVCDKSGINIFMHPSFLIQCVKKFLVQTQESRPSCDNPNHSVRERTCAPLFPYIISVATLNCQKCLKLSKMSDLAFV